MRGRPTSTTGQILPKPSLPPMEPYLISVSPLVGKGKSVPRNELAAYPDFVRLRHGDEGSSGRWRSLVSVHEGSPIPACEA